MSVYLSRNVFIIQYLLYILFSFSCNPFIILCLYIYRAIFLLSPGDGQPQSNIRLGVPAPGGCFCESIIQHWSHLNIKIIKERCFIKCLNIPVLIRYFNISVLIRSFYIPVLIRSFYIPLS